MEYKLTIGWLYSDLMSTYGDRGNIIVLQKRCEWRGTKAEVLNLNEGFDEKLLNNIDILFMGGAQDTQQQIVSKDFTQQKISILKKKIENGTPGLYICGAYQFLGKYYKDADGTKIKGLGIFDLYTEHPGEGKDRLIGNVVIKDTNNNIIVGFENHGGRTCLGDKLKPFAQVVKGFGNNGEDKKEGTIYKNSIGTYLHGPILPKNPEIADWLIEIALERKYKKKIKLEKLDDSLSQKAKKIMLRRIFN
ncbi:MAG: cobalamin biosynthesis protein CobQ [Patescibacteria group bacterium]